MSRTLLCCRQTPVLIGGPLEKAILRSRRRAVSDGVNYKWRTTGNTGSLSLAPGRIEGNQIQLALPKKFK